jgi:hypothetical protein
VGHVSKRNVIVGLVAGFLVLVAVVTLSQRNAGERSDAPPAADASGSPDRAAVVSEPSEGAAAAPQNVQPDDEASRPMAEAFRTGELPEPLPAIRGNADTAAATLAAFIAARDSQSLPALLTAITTAGFAVRNEDGSLLQAVTPGQGLAFDAWEVAAMAKIYRERQTVTISRLADDLRVLTGVAHAPFERLLIDGVAAQAKGSSPHLRFTARLIAELGRRADVPYDLLDAPDPSSVELDAVQAALILRRLFGELAAVGQQANRAANDLESHALPGFAAVRPAVVRAAWRQDACSELGKGDTAMILDIAAILMGAGWGQVLDAIGPASEGYARFLSIANTLLAYAKLLATYASIDTEIAMSNPPLVRTTNAEPGQRRVLTATVTVDSGGWDRYNCVRTALNAATGVDFSLLGDGPAEGVELTWRVENPEDGQVVGITTGGPRIQDPGTYAGVGGEGTAVGDPTRSVTDAEGRARIYLEGTPRIPYLPQPHMPVMKQARVRTNLRVKGGDIKGDAVDLAGQALGGIGAIATLPVEILFRVPWATVADKVVQIQDWETCDSGEWYGTMTSTTTYENVSVRTGETPDVVMKQESRYSHTATIQVAGDAATASIETEELVASDNRSGYGHFTNRQQKDARYSGPVRVSIAADPRLGTYSVGFERPDPVGTARNSGTCQRPAPYKCQPPTPSTRPWTGDGRYLSSLSGKLDPDNPTVINDTQTSGDRTKHTFSVNLRRCQ